ncbi:hypothetical protein KIH86_02885 [Paenibacillus sp. HN-1]|uniref:hypothetical protein n=1 Tax=Paenibacillus TaxID=44249 RepID=UPI001CA9BA45|nr:MULTISPECIES: hypothetical protein [Paenibacillus]MBY9080965.1 hypothetical protein [Paenibacillus sp. CGMCC 1.18879]MBY9083177.1 hypothetical protein [Paenibacillus sinensis]
MLSDNARKLLRIMYFHRQHFGVSPPMWQLIRKSSRRPEQIRAALQELVDERYIDWRPGAPTETIVIIEGWERQELRPTWMRRK